ncbi:MAG: aminopeptidase P family protein [Geobacter sp.]|nr:aminopeptidase P family protein [Geobacter sp.]
MLNRVTAVRRYLESTGADALLVSDINNIRYLAGFTGSSALLLLAASDGWFLTDSRYTEQARQEVHGFQIIEYSRMLEGISGCVNAQGFRRVAFEAANVTVEFHDSLARSIPECEFVPLETGIDAVRAVKDEPELAALRRVAALVSESFLKILDGIKPGVREREVAMEFEFAMRRAGIDNKAFDFIVASGERGALPHGKASDKAIRSGELVTVDFGGILDGYNSDETVTVAVGEPDNRQREIYHVVKDAHDRAIDAARPGIPCRELDAVARDYINSQGYGDYFGHGLGHGVGLEVHEKPVISPRSEGVVEEGMVFTIEPGIYIPGWGGVRIEDTVRVHRDGCEIITQVPKDLIIVE